MIRSKIRSLSLDHYDRSQRRLLSLSYRYVKGEDVADQIRVEYSRLCYSIEPSKTERAFMVLFKELEKVKRNA